MSCDYMKCNYMKWNYMKSIIWNVTEPWTTVVVFTLIVITHTRQTDRNPISWHMNIPTCATITMAYSLSNLLFRIYSNRIFDTTNGYVWGICPTRRLGSTFVNICFHVKSVGIRLPSLLGEEWHIVKYQYLTCLMFILHFRYHYVIVCIIK